MLTELASPLPRRLHRIQTLQHLRCLKHATPPTLIYRRYDARGQYIVECPIRPAVLKGEALKGSAQTAHKICYVKLQY